MSADMNHNYAFVFYDVGEKRVNKVFKICKKYFVHHQKSVFRGSITPADLLKLKQELKKAVNQKEDYITIIKLMSKSSFDEETIGRGDKNSESIIL